MPNPFAIHCYPSSIGGPHPSQNLLTTVSVGHVGRHWSGCKLDNCLQLHCCTSWTDLQQTRGIGSSRLRTLPESHQAPDPHRPRHVLHCVQQHAREAVRLLAVMLSRELGVPGSEREDHVRIGLAIVRLHQGLCQSLLVKITCCNENTSRLKL